MNAITLPNGDTIEVERTMLEVTRLHRPDTDWRHVDAAGHVHRWHDGMAPALDYKPDRYYTLPTLLHVLDYPGDDEYPATSHYECARCGARVEPGYRADDTRQYIAGLWHCRLNGRSVTREELETYMKEHGLA